MIVVTRRDRREFGINPDLIERIHANPDTTLHMADGSTYIVEESLQEVIDLITDYRARVISMARHLGAAGPGNGPGLGIVRAAEQNSRK